MRSNTLLYIIIGVIIGALAMWIFAVISVRPNNFAAIRMMGNIDQHFIEQMIPHHQDAITMAKLALQKSKRPEIKELSQNIIDSQSREIDQMEKWYKDWYGTDVVQDRQFMGMMGDETDILRLENAEDFDKAFLEEMITHHQMAVMMATMLQNGTTRSEMSQLAKNIIDTQTKEINDMRSWYRQWYGQ